MKPIIRKIIIGISILSIIGIGIGIYFALRTGKGPDGCGGGGYLCKITGKCIDSNFCGGDGLVNSESDCKCKLDCPSGQQSFPSSIDMKQDSTDSTKWVADGNIHCGIPCPLAGDGHKIIGSQGGKGWCAPDPDQYCGTGPIYVPNQKQGVDQGCFPKSTWTQCPNSLCPKSDDGSNVCTDDTGICILKDYCGKSNSPAPAPANLYQACTQNTDCADIYGNKGLCNFNDSILTDKNITKVGYCVPDGNKLYFDAQSQYCTTLDKIGNDSNKLLKICTDSAASQGVDGSIQCANTDAAEGCAKYGICAANDWQARFENDESNCDPTAGKYDNKRPFCCAKDKTIGTGTDKWCCPEANAANCLNITEFPYSANILNISGKNYTDSIDCTVDDKGDSCVQDYEADFQTSLTATKFTPSDTPGDSNFATLYCDTDIHKCKAKCGYVESNNPTTNISYIVTDDSTTDPSNKISFCTPKDTGCAISSTTNWNIENVPDPINNIPICYSSDNPPTGSDNDKFYWSAPDDHKKSYVTKFSRTMAGDNCNIPSVCAEQGSQITGVYKVTPGTDSSGQKTCDFTVNCDNKYDVNPTHMNQMVWTDGLTKLDGSNWTTCPSPGGISTICPKPGGCPCSDAQSWKPIAQNAPYNPVPVPSPSPSPSYICTGLSSGDIKGNKPKYNIPQNLTTSLKYYDKHNSPPCSGNMSVTSNLLPTGEYCQYGVNRYSLECNKKPKP